MISKISPIAILFLFAVSFHTAAQDRYLTTLTLHTGETVVVAEGDYEARSIGSFSVRLYEAADHLDATTFYLSGLIQPRDGIVEKVVQAQVNDARKQDIVVIIRSVGSGGYLSAYAFSALKGKLVLNDVVEGLAQGSDPVQALRQSSNKKK